MVFNVVFQLQLILNCLKYKLKRYFIMYRISVSHLSFLRKQIKVVGIGYWPLILFKLRSLFFIG